jgi:hypothetical protein
MSAVTNFRFIQNPEDRGLTFVERSDVPGNTYEFGKTYRGEVQESGEVYLYRPNMTERFGDAIPRKHLVQMDQYLALIAGYWARGDTPAAAAKGILKQSAIRRKEVAVLFLIVNDPKPYVDGMGYVCIAADATLYRIGKFKRLSQILNISNE